MSGCSGGGFPQFLQFFGAKHQTSFRPKKGGWVGGPPPLCPKKKCPVPVFVDLVTWLTQMAGMIGIEWRHRFFGGIHSAERSRLRVPSSSQPAAVRRAGHPVPGRGFLPSARPHRPARLPHDPSCPAKLVPSSSPLSPPMSSPRGGLRLPHR